MKIAILIDCYRLLIAYTYNCLWLILQIDTDATVLCLHIDE